MGSVSVDQQGQEPPKLIETQCLIVGAGPAGASLACFLSHPPYSITGLLVAAAPGTSQTPRAHITNPAAFECLRDIGLEAESLAQATEGDCMIHTRWCHDMTGEEYARIYSWGNDPKRHGDYARATPCRHVDLPQTLLEPVLVKRAISDGWDVRFSNSFLSMEKAPDGSHLSRIRDDRTQIEYMVKSQYIFGADGGRSHVIRSLNIPMIKKPGQGLAINVLVNFDLSNFVEERKGNLHWVFQPETEYPDFGWSALVRMVKPWHEWMFILFPVPGKEFKEPTTEELMKRCRDLVGLAEYYSVGTVHCLGDAVHRHPPFNGLGSNTCIQDAYNLAWKVKYVTNGLAAPSLLESYSAERQPIGLGVITRANQGIRDHSPIWDAMGLSQATPSERMQIFELLKMNSREGRERRKQLSKAIEGSSHEFHGIGIEMNHRYNSKAVYLEDEVREGRAAPAWPEDPILYHRASTYPGHRLPHAWLNTRFPTKDHTSTVDLAGHGNFCLLTGIGGEEWTEAAKVIAKELGITVRTHSIGWAQEYEDIYRDWENGREIEEDGCVLVRPDRFVCWRAMTNVGDCEAKLRKVLISVLGRQ